MFCLTKPPAEKKITDDGAVIIGQGRRTGPCGVWVTSLIRCEQKAGRVAYSPAESRTVWERTVGEGDVQIALPGHLPRLVDGVLRCNDTTGLLFTARSHSSSASDLLKLQRKTTAGKSTTVPCCTHTGCLPSAEVLLCHWRCGFNHR